MASEPGPTSWVRATKPLLVDKRRLTYFRRSRSAIPPPPPPWNIKTSRTRLRSWLNYRGQPGNSKTCLHLEAGWNLAEAYCSNASRKLFHVSYTLINKPSHAISRQVVVNIFQPRGREKNDKRVWNVFWRNLTFRRFVVNAFEAYFSHCTRDLSFVILFWK